MELEGHEFKAIKRKVFFTRTELSIFECQFADEFRKELGEFTQGISFKDY